MMKCCFVPTGKVGMWISGEWVCEHGVHYVLNPETKLWDLLVQKPYEGPYKDCPMFMEHGACHCSTGVLGTCQIKEVPESYEGLYCVTCGAQSGNTDQCVACAQRSLERDRREGSST